MLKNRYSCLTVDRYVIMPNHIYVILILSNGTEGRGTAEASPRPTMDVAEGD